MKAHIVYPIVLDVKIKIERIKKKVLIVDRDRIRYFDKRFPKEIQFETLIDDCEIFDKNSPNDHSCELHLISRSNSFLERIIMHKNSSIINFLKNLIEDTILSRKPQHLKNDILAKVAKSSSVQTSLIYDEKNSIELSEEEINEKAFENSNISKRVLQIISLPFENFKNKEVKLQTSNIYFLKEKLYKNEKEVIQNSLLDLQISNSFILEKFLEIRYQLSMSLILLFIQLFRINFLFVLLVLPLIIYSEKRRFYMMIYNLLPDSVINLLFLQKSNNIKSGYNANYYLKSNIIVKKNFLTIYNFISQIENDIFWKKYLIEIDESGSIFNYKMRLKDDNYSSGEFSRNTTIIKNSIIITDYNDKDVLNVIILESSEYYNFTKITFYTLLNNSFNVIYFKSVISSLKNFISYINLKLNDDIYDMSKPYEFLDKHSENSSQNVSGI